MGNRLRGSRLQDVAFWPAAAPLNVRARVLVQAAEDLWAKRSV